MFTLFEVPDGTKEGRTKTLYVGVAKLLQFQWEKPTPSRDRLVAPTLMRQGAPGRQGMPCIFC